jgi:hypothetical protein
MAKKGCQNTAEIRLKDLAETDKPKITWPIEILPAF